MNCRYVRHEKEDDCSLKMRTDGRDSDIIYLFQHDLREGAPAGTHTTLCVCVSESARGVKQMNLLARCLLR